MISAALSFWLLRKSLVTSSTTSAVAHPAVDVGVEVGVLGAHAAHVERQIGLHGRERGARSSVMTIVAVAQISKSSRLRRAPGRANPSSSHSLYVSAIRGV